MRRFLGAALVSTKRGNPRKVSYTIAEHRGEADRQARSHRAHSSKWRFAYRVNVYAKGEQA